MEADVSNCLACDEAGQTTPLRCYHLNLKEVVQCCSKKQCTYHLQNAKLTNIAVEENAGLSLSLLCHKSSNAHRNNLAASMLQWSNRNSLCWLDASMCVLVMIKSLRECISKVKKRCILKQLFEDYDRAMAIYLEECLIDVNRNVPQDNNDLKFLEGKVYLQEVVGTDDADVQSLIYQDITSVDSRLDLNGTVATQSKCNQQMKLKEATNILNDIRDKIFAVLQPILKCKLGSEDSPLFAIPALLNESKPFAEHFFARYHLEFNCTLCGYIQVTCFQKACISFVEISSEFKVGCPVMLTMCPECNASHQPNQLVYHKLSQCVMMQFVNGLPHNSLDQLKMSIAGDQYELTAVIQYKQAPKHFVAWMRDVHENLWIMCNDLMSCECKWSNKVPDIPPKEIHIIVLERQKKQCVSCFKQLDYVNSLMHSTVSAKLAKPAGQKYQPAPSPKLAASPKPPPPIILHIANANFSMNERKFIGFQESKRKNVENIHGDTKQMDYVDGARPHTKRLAVTDNVLLDKYLDTCLQGNVALSSGTSIAKQNLKPAKDHGNSRTTKQLFNQSQSKQSDKVSVVMAAIPDRLLSQVCIKKPRKISNRNEAVKIGHESSIGSSHIRRKCGQFYTGHKGKFPGYSFGQKLEDDDIKLFDGFRKNSVTKNQSVDLTVPSPNPSVASELSSTSDVQINAEMIEVDTPSECSLDSSGLDSQGSGCHKENISQNATLDNNAFTESGFELLDDNQDDFFSSLLETNFMSIPHL